MPAFDLSPYGIWHNATGLVQAVLVTLILCSVGCWAIIIEKVAAMARLSRAAAELEAAKVEKGFVSLPASAVGHVVIAAGREEWIHRRTGESSVDRCLRIEQAMREAVFEALMKAEVRLPYLATIGSSAPFIGLFGTVWGIMHSFASIAQANDTSLAVVAPGIAEALSTTAVGLAAAIPASIGYNKLTSDFGVLVRRFNLAIGRIARRAGADDEANQRHDHTQG